MNHKLLILDLNGVLCKKKYKCIEPIQGCCEFLKECSKHFKLALWTSGTSKNHAEFVEWIQRESQIKFEFCWYREFTQLDPDYGINPKIKPHDTIKNLEQ